MKSKTTKHFPENPDRVNRLGRLLNFDARSLSYRVPTPRAKLLSKTWIRAVPPLDQGSLGCCTCAALIGVIASQPHFRTRTRYDIEKVRKLYEYVTKEDEFYGAWKPTDTGSSVLSAMKSASKHGYIKNGYNWCFSLNDVLYALSRIGPVQVGTRWYSNFDQPIGAHAEVRIAGQVEGGHSYELIGIDFEKKRVTAVNSWGLRYGNEGRFTMSFATLERLLDEDGEAAVVIPVPTVAAKKK